MKVVGLGAKTMKNKAVVLQKLSFLCVIWRLLQCKRTKITLQCGSFYDVKAIILQRFKKTLHFRCCSISPKCVVAHTVTVHLS